MKKILTVCQRGNNRSAACALILKDQWQLKDVIAVGIETTTPETFAMMANWADVILVMGERGLYDKVPQEFYPKTHHLDIGPDYFGVERNKAILDACSNQLRHVAHLLR